MNFPPALSTGLCFNTDMAKQEPQPQEDILPASVSTPLWELGITELTGHNIETAGREEVNELLKSGWVLLHIYTLKYREDGVWRERPMAILGKR